VFIASKMITEFLGPVINSFSKFDIIKKENGFLIGGINLCFLKDNKEWGCFLENDYPIYYEIGSIKWMLKPLLNYVDQIGFRCITREMESYLIEINEKIIKIEDDFVDKIRKKLIEIEESL